MPWEFKKVEDKRKELIEAHLDGVSMTELSKRYKISRKTAYKWYNRYLELGAEEGLRDFSKAPHNPNSKFNNQEIDKALDLKIKKPTWGPKKIIAKLETEYPDQEWPSPTWLYEVFKEHHLVTSRRLRRRVPATHPLKDVNASNDVWMADFKGWFLTKNREKCEPLTITDGYSRYLISCRHLLKKSVDYVWPIFAEAFKEYGLPNRVRTDNGPPFGCIGIGRLTQLS
ncbi:MAG TPA: helix-turn-helix domain-containing protein, partial [Rhabdochlamydiaceae bacterium]|nr:helix-turn-helix domain-containing protein [Rhabdochlamydiaceae bacterium]